MKKKSAVKPKVNIAERMKKQEAHKETLAIYARREKLGL
jgi:hypothetical protein